MTTMRGILLGALYCMSCDAELSVEGSSASAAAMSAASVDGKPALRLLELGLDLHRVIGYGLCTP